MRRTLLFGLVALLWSCQLTDDVETKSAELGRALPDDVFSTLKNPADAHAELCDHDATDTTFPANADRITNRFCQDVQGGAVPTPHGLDELLAMLDLSFTNPNGGNGTGGNPAFAILGHSSALTAREVSSIAPTAFIFSPLDPEGTPPRDYTFLAYDPGESFVEVASFSPSDMAVNFYLVLFDKACTNEPGGCSWDDMLTPKQTTGWSNVRIYESTTALNDTIADCRQCHIGSGTDRGDPLILRMQELAAPHTHWFDSQTVGGASLLGDFHAAHGTTEAYGGIPAKLIDQSNPELMAGFIKAAGFADQPNAFPSAQDETDVQKMAPQQPAANVPMGWSSAWEAVYQAGASGTAIAAPYHDVKVTDPDRLAMVTKAYVDARTGKGPLAQDIREVLLGTALVDMGFEPRPNQDGHAILLQQCGQCHNARLDPTITRDRFLVDQPMSREEKDLAIERIKTAIDTRLTMPPPLFRLPSATDRAAMIAELEK